MQKRNRLRSGQTDSEKDAYVLAKTGCAPLSKADLAIQLAMPNVDMSSCLALNSGSCQPPDLAKHSFIRLALQPRSQHATPHTRSDHHEAISSSRNHNVYYGHMRSAAKAVQASRDATDRLSSSLVSSTASARSESRRACLS